MPVAIAASSILALTVTLSLTRPVIGRLRISPAGAAIIGAILSILFGLINSDVILRALGFLVMPILTLVSLMVITLVAEQAGLFRLLAVWIARAAGGSGNRLFAYLFFTGTLTGTLFTNDAAVLIFTPLVFKLIEDVSEGKWPLRNKIPYYFAVLYVANLVGPLVISNPINIIVSSLFGIGFAEYASWMMLPAIVSIVTTYFGLWLCFRRWIPKTYSVPSKSVAAINRPFLVATGVILGLTLAGFFLEHVTRIPTGFVAAGGAAALVFIYHRFIGGAVAPLVRGVAWDVVVFVIGIFLVANGLRAAGLTQYLGNVIMSLPGSLEPAPIFQTGFVTAICSSFMNNHPVADTMGMVIRDLPISAFGERMMVFAALIGGDLGPKMLPIGSLAALLWFRILRDKGVTISYWQYIRIGVPVTLAAIFLALSTLGVEMVLRGPV